MKNPTYRIIWPYTSIWHTRVNSLEYCYLKISLFRKLKWWYRISHVSNAPFQSAFLVSVESVKMKSFQSNAIYDLCERNWESKVRWVTFCIFNSFLLHAKLILKIICSFLWLHKRFHSSVISHNATLKKFDFIVSKAISVKKEQK